MMENTFGMNIIPDDERQRIEALKRYQILDTPPESTFDHVAKLAAQIFNVPIALISLVDSEQVFFKANKGLGQVRSAERGVSLCSLAILQPDVTVFENAREEKCLLSNPNVIGTLGLQFYAGAPITTPDGFRIGTICIIDQSPRKFSEAEKEILAGLAKVVIDELEMRLSAIKENDQSIQHIEVVKESERRFRLLIEQTPVAIFLFKGEDFIIEAANSAMLDIVRKDKSILNVPLLDAMPELAEQGVYGLLQQVYATGKPIYGSELEIQINRNGQSTIGYFNFSLTPMIEGGKVTGIIDVSIEVTDQVVARKKVEHAEENLRLAMESGDLSIWQYDEISGKIALSGSLRKLLGFSDEEEIQFGTLFSYVHEEDQKRVSDALTAAFANHADYNVEFKITGRDGKDHWVRSIAKLITNIGEAPFLTGIMANITEQRQDEIRKNDFISMVSHELKTPLTSIIGYLQLLSVRAKKADEAITLTISERATKQAQKMTLMINGFLNVSRLETGKIHIDRQVFNMADLMKESESESIATIASHRIIYAPVQKMMVNADMEKIGQVIHNLISNAVKYSPLGSTIYVACEAIGSNARVSVKDSGMGIAQKDQEKLFDRFYRVEHKDVKNIGGFGIGLYLCAEIINRHEGQIAVESELDKGSIFYFSIPLDQNTN